LRTRLGIQDVSDTRCRDQQDGEREYYDEHVATRADDAVLWFLLEPEHGPGLWEDMLPDLCVFMAPRYDNAQESMHKAYLLSTSICPCHSNGCPTSFPLAVLSPDFGALLRVQR
jgi:hypothetical protein